MKYLLPDFWVNFKQDGKLFEHLSKVLIEYEYDQQDFYIVGGPGDGGKDIVKELSLLGDYHSQIWAQCKFHHKTLSFDDISYTLLMAYLRNTNQILIFSYSKVSDTFWDNLSEYITMTRKDVILYADDRLEQLILKHREKLADEHPEFFSYFPDVRELYDDTFLTDYQLYIDGSRITSDETTISINSICELVITATNHTLKTQHVKLSLIRNSTSRCFCFLDNLIEQERSIPADHTDSFRINIKLKRNVNKIGLPSFKLYFGDKSVDLYLRKKVNCRWLADTALIGAQYYNALENITRGFRYPHFHLAYIYGKSGVGKSRLIKEIREYSVRTGKQMVYIDSEKKDISCRKLVELLCSKMTLLPIFHEKVTVLSNSDDVTMEFATRILYDHTFNIAREWQDTAKFFAYLMTSQKFVVAFDNFQHFDSLALKIVNYLITLLKNTSCDSDILLGINTDYIYKNSVFDEFFCQLKCACGNAPEFYTAISLEGFEPRDAELYIRECLTYQTSDVRATQIDYERAVHKIAEYCGGNPFYIQQYLLYLDQKGILRRSRNTLYYFHDLKGFLNSFNEVPKNVESLIQEREQLFLACRTDELVEKYQSVIYLVNLTKTLPETIYYAIIEDTRLLDELCDMGFLSLTDGAITPIHSYYTLYYASKYALDVAPRSLLAQFIEAVRRFDLNRDLALPCFWAKNRLGMAKFEDLQLVLAQIISWNFDCASFDFCLKSISNAAEKYADLLGIDEYLGLYSNICLKLDESLGIRHSIYYYEKFLTSFLEKCDRYRDHVTPALSLITQGMIHLVNLEKYNECIKAANAIVKVSGSFHEADRLEMIYQANRCRIMIFNRNEAIPEAIFAAEENLRILEAESVDSAFRDRMIYSAKRSIGNTYFYSTLAYQKRWEIVSSWNDSFVSYVEKYGMSTTEGYSNQPKVAAFAKGIAADMISEQEDRAEQKARFFQNAFDRMHMMYYEMQIRLLMAIYLTWKWSGHPAYVDHLGEIERYIDQTLDIAAVYSRQLTTINAFHLRAVTYYLAKNYEFSFDNYNIAARLLTEYLGSEKDFARWDYFWVDYARAGRKYDKAAMLAAIEHYDVRTKEVMQRICSMTDRDFEKYETTYVPMTALTDKEQRINFPKI